VFSLPRKREPDNPDQCGPQPQGTPSSTGYPPKLPTFPIHNEFPGRGMLYKANRPASPTAEAREALMGFSVGNTGATGLSQTQRIHLLGQCTDQEAIALIISTIRAHRVSSTTNTPDMVAPKQFRGGYTSSQPTTYPSWHAPLHNRVGMVPHAPGRPPPVPHRWTPKFIPEN
jgi:hypothetical protein